jgi:hypothetical protein
LGLALVRGTYADVILDNTTGGRIDEQRTIEAFRRLGGDEAAAITQRDLAELTEESAAEFHCVCPPPARTRLKCQCVDVE